jgi:ribonuclease BN (tRNA processing enzyme)
MTEQFFGRDGVLSNDLRARTELKPSQDVWVARGGTLPRPWPAPKVTEISGGDVIEGAGWRITSAMATHAQPVLDCMGFALEADGAKFVYSGDTGITPAIEALSQDADMLLHWCYRLDGQEAHPSMTAMTPTPSEIAQMATRAGVKQLMLTHFRVHMDTDAGHAGAKAGMAAHFNGPARIVEDLEVFDL